jgi:hypothetical protein
VDPGNCLERPGDFGDKRNRPGNFTSTSRAPFSKSTITVTSPSPRTVRLLGKTCNRPFVAHKHPHAFLKARGNLIDRVYLFDPE